MFLTDMGLKLSSFFQATTMIVSIPSVVVLTCLCLTLWGGQIRFSPAMAFALAFLPMFGLGGLAGIPLGLAATDIPLHDTYYVVGHFHYIVAPGTLFALIAGVYFWFPKITGQKLDERLGWLHFWPSFISMNLVFFPMLLMGLAGVSRRLYNPTVYAHGRAVQHYNVLISFAAWALALAQLVFIYNLAKSWLRGKKGLRKNS
jgi:cytochrome c oxidase subunit 1